jgi:hypothetical protein
MFSSSFHHKVYLAGLAITLCSLPSSIFGVSVGIITLALNFILSGSWNTKLQRLKGNPWVWVFIAMYLPILFSGMFSENQRLGLEIIRLWLPILILPLIISMSDRLSKKEFTSLIFLFLLSVFAVTIIGTYNFINHNYSDIRKIFPYISHIRLALMINLSIAFLISFLKEWNRISIKIALIALLAWFIVFLFVLKSITGLLFLSIISLLIIIKALKHAGSISRFAIITGSLTVFFLFASYVLHKYDEFKTIKLTPDNQPKQFTLNGNPYLHDTLSVETENGYLVNLNICDKELKKEWEKRSSVPFDSMDMKGQPLRKTLIRYLTSYGFTKDSAGINLLDSIDVKLIESGYTNKLFRKTITGFESRLYELFYEIRNRNSFNKIKTGSLTQRLIYLKACWHVIKKNPILGVGYGDVLSEMNQYYEVNNINLPQKYRYMPHNQYLTIWASAGILGLIIFLVSLTLPFFVSSNFSEFPVMFYWILITLSMLFEDTLLTHTGISFMAIFSSIFLFGFKYSYNQSK